MSQEKFTDFGKIEAIEKLFENTGYQAFDKNTYESSSKSQIVNASKMMLEGIDFDLVYFPLKHLGYKAVIEVTGELYASLARPQSISIILGISAKLDFSHIKELWSGVTAAASEHGYKKLSLDLVPSKNGLCISVFASGETSNLTFKRRPSAKSMDLICISDNLGAAFLGMQILDREKHAFEKTGENDRKKHLEEYKHLVGAYLKPELNSTIIKELEDAEIIPSYGYFVTNGLADSVKRLVKDSGLGAKIYVDRIPFAGKTFDIAKEFEIDPVSAALNGGDDCRLLFTIPIGKHDKFRHDFQTFDIIGHLAKPEVGSSLVTPDGVELSLKSQAWK